MKNFREILQEKPKTMSDVDDPIIEINEQWKLFLNYSMEYYKISVMAGIFDDATKKEQMKFVVGVIYDYGFENYPFHRTTKAINIVKEIFDDVILLNRRNSKNKSKYDKDIKKYQKYFDDRMKYVNNLIRTNKIEGYEHIENSLFW